MKNKEKLLENVKQKISISNFQKEEKIEMNRTKKSILKASLIACTMVISITGVVFAEDIGNFIKNFFGANTSEGVDIAVNNGYVADAQTEYKKAEGIEIKVDSLIMDDFNFAINFNVKLDERYNIKDFASVSLEDLKIVDETGEIVFNTHSRVEQDMIEKSYMGAYSFLVTEKGSNEFILSLSATGNPKPFPKSKHLIITFTKLLDRKNYYEEAINKVYEGDWKFEVDVPKEFYTRENVIYKATKCSDENVEIDKIEAVLSNTALKISIPEIETDKIDYELLHTDNPKSIYDKIAIQKEYVKTSKGKKFETAQRSDGDGGYSLPAGENKIIGYRQTFNLTKFDATDKITIHLFTNKKEEIKIELERNK